MARQFGYASRSVLHVTLAITLGGGSQALAQASSGATAPQVVVGPNVLVSRDVDYPHWEVTIAAAPWDPAVLIAASSVETPFGRQQAVYTSRDTGGTWTGYLAPGWLGDPQVAAGAAPGELLFLGISRETYVGRSEDAGRNWMPLQALQYADHPQVVVDYTEGRFRGRIYSSGLGCEEERKTHHLCLFRSDDGRTWRAPVVYVGDTLGYQSNNPIVLSDGTLIVPYVSFPRDLRAAYRDRKDFRAVWQMISTDGGRTFTPPRFVHRTERFSNDHAWFAVDLSARHRDRIYMSWRDPDAHDGRIFVRYSDDRGRTWSSPVVVDATAPVGTRQRRANVAVNKDGVVGVRWLDSRHGRETPRDNEWYFEEWDEYFAASVDGGVTFLPAVRVSDQTSRGTSDGMWQTSARDDEAIVVGHADAWGGGEGDYLGLATDAHGLFHPMWIDKRDGVRRVYTAGIEVVGGAIRASPRKLQATAVSREEFRVELEPARYDSVSGILEVPVRVRNLSGRPLHAPLQLMITIGRTFDDQTQPNLTLLTMSGQESIAGRPLSNRTTASYNLDPVLRDPMMLLAGEQTAPLLLRLKAVDRTATSRLSFALTAGR